MDSFFRRIWVLGFAIYLNLCLLHGMDSEANFEISPEGVCRLMCPLSLLSESQLSEFCRAGSSVNAIELETQVAASISNADLEHIGTCCPNLKVLKLEDCRHLSPEGLRHLHKCQKLEVLTLHQCPQIDANDLWTLLNATVLAKGCFSLDDTDGQRFEDQAKLKEKSEQILKHKRKADFEQSASEPFLLKDASKQYYQVAPSFHPAQYAALSPEQKQNVVEQVKRMKGLFIPEYLLDGFVRIYNSDHSSLTEAIKKLSYIKLIPEQGSGADAQALTSATDSASSGSPAQSSDVIEEATIALLRAALGFPNLEVLCLADGEHLDPKEGFVVRSDGSLLLGVQPSKLDERQVRGIGRAQSYIKSLALRRLVDSELRSMAAHFEMLPQLTSLDLEGCREITDAGLAHLKALPQLTSLSLEGCSEITDAGLAHLEALSELTSLTLVRCPGITDAGLAHLEPLHKLACLKLSGYSKITDAGLVHLKQLYELTYLGLPGCDHITDAGFTHISGLSKLTGLDLRLCKQITDTSLARFKDIYPRLTYLDLGDCSQFTDTSLACLEALSELTFLSLVFFGDISDTGLIYLKALTKLTHLNLYDCNQITDTGLAHLKTLSALTYLNLDCCSYITDAGLAQLKTFPLLSSLKLDRCTRLTDASLAHIRDFYPQLTYLDLSESLNKLCECKDVTDLGLSYLIGLSRLTSLNLSACKQITDAGVAHLKALLELSSLNISECTQITDLTLHHLKSLPKLNSLNLNQCDGITNDGLAHLRAFPQLKSLSLCGCNQVTNKGLFHLSKLRGLTYLNLSRCKNISDEKIDKLKGYLKRCNINHGWLWY